MTGMTLDVKPEGLEEYKQHHRNVWPQVEQALKSAGLSNLSIFVLGTRMFYYAEFQYENDAQSEFKESMRVYATQPRVQEWEALQHTYQSQLPGSSGDVWWQPMDEIYHLD
jgi:L-rhamnose mutarotase